MPLFKLYPYQIDAVDRMHNGCILCGGVGSGKSLTAIAYYYSLNGGDIRSEEYTHMDPEPLDLYIITTARKRDTFEWDSDLSHFLISREGVVYDHKVVIDSWNNIEKYVGIEDAFFIFDEQRVVGKGKWVRSFLKITKNNQWILLSATPGDTWSDYIPVFIANGFYARRSDFNAQHVIYKPYMNFPVIDRYINEGKLIRFRKQILVDMDFNENTERHHKYVMCSYDRDSYVEACRNRWNRLEEKPIENASEFCQYLRRIVNTDPSRIEMILELTKEHDRMIVFYNYNYELDILKNANWDKDIVVAEWNGHKHEPLPDSNRWIYLVQYTAGAEGWNCITTDTMIFYSENYSFKLMTQAAGRINRLNTPYHDLYYYHFTTGSSIDKRIAMALRNKKKFNEKSFAYSIKMKGDIKDAKARNSVTFR